MNNFNVYVEHVSNTSNNPFLLILVHFWPISTISTVFKKTDSFFKCCHPNGMDLMFIFYQDTYFHIISYVIALWQIRAATFQYFKIIFFNKIVCQKPGEHGLIFLSFIDVTSVINLIHSIRHFSSLFLFPINTLTKSNTLDL